jgi:hypothetical protein
MFGVSHVVYPVYRMFGVSHVLVYPRSFFRRIMSDEDRDDPGLKAQRKQWLPVNSVTYETMAEGRMVLKGMEGGKWKWAASPGDGRTSSNFQCNAHKECPRLLKVQICDNGYVIMGTGEHGTEVKGKRRKNSTLNFEMEAEVRKSMDQGGKSAGLRVALTMLCI